MKLRNKKTGEIVEATDFDILSGYNSLTKLNEDWEDYEEPKEDEFFKFTPALLDNRFVALIVDKKATREEAEKAVEKLKAWKRLEDKGFRFLGVKGLDYAIDFEINPPYTHITFDEYTATEDQKEFYNDLMLLFGGEE